MNNWSFIGNLGGNAESKSLPGGTNVVNFSVALNYGKGDNQTTTWVRCKWFGERGSKVAEYIRKGERIGVEGRCELETWDNNGKTGAALVCNVQNVTLLSQKQEGAPPASGSGSAPRQSTGPSYQPPAGQSAPHQKGAFEDDEIPF